MNMEAPGQGNNQEQLPARGRGDRRGRGASVPGGEVGRKGARLHGRVGGRGRGGRRQQTFFLFDTHSILERKHKLE